MILKNKKGVELAFNTIIGAAIALIVFIVIVLIFTGGMGETIDKFKKILYKSTGKADCIVVGSDSSKDKDGDGYLDDKSYDVYYKDDKGISTKLTCSCDINPIKKDIHHDDGSTSSGEEKELRKKYC